MQSLWWEFPSHPLIRAPRGVLQSIHQGEARGPTNHKGVAIIRNQQITYSRNSTQQRASSYEKNNTTAIYYKSVLDLWQVTKLRLWLTPCKLKCFINNSSLRQAHYSSWPNVLCPHSRKTWCRREWTWGATALAASRASHETGACDARTDLSFLHWGDETRLNLCVEVEQGHSSLGTCRGGSEAWDLGL